MGSPGGDCENSCLRGLAGFGVRYRNYDSCRWRLCDPMNSLEPSSRSPCQPLPMPDTTPTCYVLGWHANVRYDPIADLYEA